MRKVLLYAYLLVAVLASPVPSPACGDKLLVIGRGIRFRDAFSTHPASILAYLPSGSHGLAVFSNPQWNSALKKVGHKVQVVGSEDDLGRALRTGSYELVIVE